MKLYHGTNINNFQSILERGLLKNKDWCIYLTDKIKIAKKYGEIIFEIITSKTDKISMISKNEFLIWNNIPIERIKRLK